MRRNELSDYSHEMRASPVEGLCTKMCMGVLQGADGSMPHGFSLLILIEGMPFSPRILDNIYESERVTRADTPTDVLYI